VASTQSKQCRVVGWKLGERSSSNYLVSSLDPPPLTDVSIMNHAPGRLRACWDFGTGLVVYRKVM
jgi:hypothetical protein